MKVWSVIGLLFTAAIVATIPISPQVTPVVLIFGSSMWVRISFHGGCALTR
jgi:hypothetical protein